MATMLTFCGYGVCVFMGLLCATILWFIWTNKIDLSHLLSEANGSASMSRFQLLIFSMVVAISLYLIVEKTGSFPDIPQGVLTLLGISASTYAVGKGISFSRDEGVTTPGERAAIRSKAQQMSDTGAAVDVTAAGTMSTGAVNPPSGPTS